MLEDRQPVTFKFTNFSTFVTDSCSILVEFKEEGIKIEMNELRRYRGDSEYFNELLKFM